MYVAVTVRCVLAVYTCSRPYECSASHMLCFSEAKKNPAQAYGCALSHVGVLVSQTCPACITAVLLCLLCVHRNPCHMCVSVYCSLHDPEYDVLE